MYEHAPVLVLSVSKRPRSTTKMNISPFHCCQASAAIAVHCYCWLCAITARISTACTYVYVSTWQQRKRKHQMHSNAQYTVIHKLEDAPLYSSSYVYTSMYLTLVVSYSSIAYCSKSSCSYQHLDALGWDNIAQVRVLFCQVCIAFWLQYILIWPSALGSSFTVLRVQCILLVCTEAQEMHSTCTCVLARWDEQKWLPLNCLLRALHSS
jgi:hypothetical protein